MTQLRQEMLEEVQRRNYSHRTVKHGKLPGETRSAPVFVG